MVNDIDVVDRGNEGFAVDFTALQEVDQFAPKLFALGVGNIARGALDVALDCEASDMVQTTMIEWHLAKDYFKPKQRKILAGKM